MKKGRSIERTKSGTGRICAGSATRVAYNNAIDLVESIKEPEGGKEEGQRGGEDLYSQIANSVEVKPKRKYTKRKPEVGRNKKPATKKAKGLLDARYTRIAYLQGMPLEVANPLQIRDVPQIIANEDGQQVAYKCPTTKETKAWIATTRYANAKGSLTEVLDMMEAGVEPPVKRKYVRKTKN